MESKGHNPLAVANYFIKKNEVNGIHLMKLIKLCYFAHGFTLANLETILINEYAEAWKYGPVFPTIFHEFKTARPIREMAKRYNPDTQSLEFWSSNFKQEEREIMSQVNEKYGKYSGEQLSSITHELGSPWDIAWKKGKEIRGFSINNEEIKKHFEKKINRDN